jgi:PilZ domain
MTWFIPLPIKYLRFATRLSSEKIISMERRRSPRVSIQCSVLVQLVSEPEVGLFGLSQNVSITGIRFSTETAFNVGTEVQVSFFLPNKARASARGTVVRIEEENVGRFGVAVACKQPFEGAPIPAFIRTS